jgi:hypothetical protein
MTSQVQAPEGYLDRGTDLDGFWPGEEPLHFIPRGRRVFDSSLDKTKTSTLVVGELVAPATLQHPDTKAPFKAGVGAKVGLWTKAGMAALRDLADVPVFMYPDGTKDVGRPSAMKVYKILSKTPGKRLPVLSDYRATSKPAAPSNPSSPATPTPTQGPTIPDEDIPF